MACCLIYATNEGSCLNLIIGSAYNFLSFNECLTKATIMKQLNDQETNQKSIFGQHMNCIRQNFRTHFKHGI